MRPRVVEFRLEKSEGGWWERLLKERARQHWLRWLMFSASKSSIRRFVITEKAPTRAFS